MATNTYRRGPTRTRLIVTGCLFAATLAACTSHTASNIDLVTADSAAAAGDWPTAFVSYLAAQEAEPGNREAALGSQLAAAKLLTMVPRLDVALEGRLIDWLTNAGRWSDLIALLESSVIAIPAGWGPMGSDEHRPDESPARDVYVDAFAIARYEVTNLQYQAHIAATGAGVPTHWENGSFPNGTALHPVVGVSWRQADDYCAAARKRLPTEAEWERTCRGDSGRLYPWGDEWDPARANVEMAPATDLATAWNYLTAGDTTAPHLLAVGSLPAGATPEGVCNLTGNASEWVADWYDADAYVNLPNINPIGDGPEWNHAVRGGAWLFRHDDGDLMIDKSRCGFRNSSHSSADPRTGFRCVAAE